MVHGDLLGTFSASCPELHYPYFQYASVLPSMLQLAVKTLVGAAAACFATNSCQDRPGMFAATAAVGTLSCRERLFEARQDATKKCMSFARLILDG